jgi:hypothetical protein
MTSSPAPPAIRASALALGVFASSSRKTFVAGKVRHEHAVGAATVLPVSKDIEVKRTRYRWGEGQERVNAMWRIVIIADLNSICVPQREFGIPVRNSNLLKGQKYVVGFALLERDTDPIMIPDRL